jgi:hypothetical protein
VINAFVAVNTIQIKRMPITIKKSITMGEHSMGETTPATCFLTDMGIEARGSHLWLYRLSTLGMVCSSYFHLFGTSYPVQWF